MCLRCPQDMFFVNKIIESYLNTFKKMPVKEDYTVLMDGGETNLAKKSVLLKRICRQCSSALKHQ